MPPAAAKHRYGAVGALFHAGSFFVLAPESAEWLQEQMTCKGSWQIHRKRTKQNCNFRVSTAKRSQESVGKLSPISGVLLLSKSSSTDDIAQNSVIFHDTKVEVIGQSWKRCFGRSLKWTRKNTHLRWHVTLTPTGKQLKPKTTKNQTDAKQCQTVVQFSCLSCIKKSLHSSFPAEGVSVLWSQRSRIACQEKQINTMDPNGTTVQQLLRLTTCESVAP